MRKGLPFFAAVLCVGLVCAEEKEPSLQVAQEGAQLGGWTMDYDAARTLAKEKGLPMLLNFTGSDWCPWCKLAVRDVFLRPEWSNYAADRFVQVYVDFPSKKDLLPEKRLAQNERLKQEYEIEGLPTFVLADPQNGKALHKFGLGRPGGFYGFMAEVGGALRRWPKAQESLLKGLPDGKVKTYREIVTQYHDAETMLRDWMNGRPERSEENRKKFEAMRDDIEAKRLGVERMETEYSLEKMVADPKVREQRLAALARARDYDRLVKEAATARENVEGWLLARPALNEKNTATFNDLVQELDKAIGKLQAMD